MPKVKAMVVGIEEIEWVVIEVLREICVMVIETIGVVTLIEEPIEAGMMAMASMVEAIGFKMIGATEVAAIMMIEEMMMAEGSIGEAEAEDSTDRDLQTKEGKWVAAAWAVAAEADLDQSREAGTKVAMIATEDHHEIIKVGNTMGLEDMAEETTGTRMAQMSHQ